MTDETLIETVLAAAWRRESAVHGDTHWRCVAATGLTLADAVAGCDRELVLLFGLLHDTRRRNDHVDPDHGPRAAAFTRELGSTGALALDEHTLGDGETQILDSGHLVAFSDGIDYETRTVVKGVKGLAKSFTSGEGFVFEFRGPGQIWSQTRSQRDLIDYLTQALPFSRD